MSEKYYPNHSASDFGTEGAYPCDRCGKKDRLPPPLVVGAGLVGAEAERICYACFKRQAGAPTTEEISELREERDALDVEFRAALEDIKRLRKENDGFREALAEAVGALELCALSTGGGQDLCWCSVPFDGPHEFCCKQLTIAFARLRSLLGLGETKEETT